MLADFRAWLLSAATTPLPPSEVAEPLDLHTLLGQFIALKQEVNLLTRAARAQQEQNSETLRQYGETMQALARAQEQAAGANDDIVRPLLKTLIDLADSLGLARREMRRVQEAIAALEEPLAEATPSLWARLFGSAAVERRRERRQRASEQARQFFESALTGYSMSLQRVERALQQQGLEPIPAVGEPFDPERMEVVAAVADSGRPAGEVVEEVRRGYLWRERVFRYAQVSVAKG